MTSWVPLSLHSQYSILASTCSIDALVHRAAISGLSTMALTDKGNVCGAIDFFAKCQKAGIHPVLGMEAYLSPRNKEYKQRIPDEQNYYPFTLFVRDDVGFKNLSILASASHLEGFYYVPRVDRALIAQHAKGLFVMLGAPGSSLAKTILQKGPKEQEQELHWWLSTFGSDSVFLQIQSIAMKKSDMIQDGMMEEAWLENLYTKRLKEQNLINEGLSSWSKKLGIPLVASNPCFYIDREDWHAHEILLNVHSGASIFLPGGKSKNPDRSVYPSHEYYFKTPSQIEEDFKEFPEAISCTSYLASQCTFAFHFGEKHYPIFLPPGFQKNISNEKREQACKEYLIQCTKAAIPLRYTEETIERIAHLFPDQDPVTMIESRLQYELEVIISRNLTEYLLIVQDFIAWSKSQNIPVGPGRGSGAGSITCYLLGITNIDPIGFNLLFERFINPERPSYPDIDVDICMYRRAEVIQYMMERYGEDRVAHIVTFGRMKARMALKDVGRVLGIALSKINHIMRHVSDDAQICLDEIIAQSETIQQAMQDDAEIRELFLIAQSLEGCIRNMGIHAAGIIVSPGPLVEYVPLCKPKGTDIPVSQFSMYPLEKLGMLKMDFLGLKTLSCIQIAVDNIKNSRGEHVDWERLPLDDRTTFALLNEGKTCGIFQMESSGMQELAKSLQLSCFEEIIAVLALYRPGPMQMISTFIRRKHGKEEIVFDHPSLELFLQETYGVVVYQEQVMQIAQKLAGYSLAEGDLLRRAMGKKDRKEMEIQGEKFMHGAVRLGMEETKAREIFDKLSRFAEYGFNKSHAAAYGYITYVTAYLKARYYPEWMAALMTCDANDTTRLAALIQEAKTEGAKILPPDVNQASESFVVQGNAIRFALNGIKGVGSAIVSACCKEFRENGAFRDLFSFIYRLSNERISKKTLECFVDSGACDKFGLSRGYMREVLPQVFLVAARKFSDEDCGIRSLFNDEFIFSEEASQPISLDDKRDLLLREKMLLGVSLTGDPLAIYSDLLQKYAIRLLSDVLREGKCGIFPVIFILDSIKVKVAKSSGKKFVILHVSDGAFASEVLLRSSVSKEHFDSLVENAIYLGAFLLENKQNMQMSCHWIKKFDSKNECGMSELKTFVLEFSLKESRSALSQKKNSRSNTVIRIKLSALDLTMEETLSLLKALEKCRGENQIELVFLGHPHRNYVLNLGKAYSAESKEEILSVLQNFESVIECSEEKMA